MSESAMSERMITLPGGRYVMGSTDFTPEEEGPEHTVEVAPFGLDLGRVTNRAVRRLRGGDPLHSLAERAPIPPTTRAPAVGLGCVRGSHRAVPALAR